MPTMCDNWLRIRVMTKGANRKKYYLMLEVAIARCRSEPYVCDLVYRPLLDSERRQCLQK